MQRSVYYVSKAYQGAKIRYLGLEKLVLALVTTAKPLQHYFQGHTIMAITNQLMKKILGKLDVSEKLLKWVVKLGEFDM